MRRDRGDRERGAATLLLVAVLALAGLVTAVGLEIGRVAVARVQVSSAADLAALAAAPTLDCGRAREVAEANGAHVVDCEVQEADVTVMVALRVPMAGRQMELRAESRAGPP